MDSGRVCARQVVGVRSNAAVRRGGTGSPFPGRHMGVPRTLGRLRRSEEFRRVYQGGIRRAGALVVVHACPNGLGTVRLGVSVARRFGRATARNRLKRRLREAVRWHRPRMQTGVDLVVMPRSGAGTAAYGELRDGLSAALEAAGVLTGDDRGEP